MNWPAHSIDAATRSAAPRKPRSQRIDWRAVAGLGLMALALVFAFGGNA